MGLSWNLGASVRRLQVISVLIEEPTGLLLLFLHFLESMVFLVCDDKECDVFDI
jgi:hypothetical protein